MIRRDRTHRMNQTIFSIVTALLLLGSTSGNAHAQALIQSVQVTSTTASTSSKPVARPESEPVELTGMLAAHNDTRARLRLPALTWSSELETAAKKVADAGATGYCSQTTADKAGKKGDASIFWAPGLRRLSVPTAQEIMARYVVSRWNETKADPFTRMTAPKAKTVGCAKVICPNQNQIWACKYDD